MARWRRRRPAWRPSTPSVPYTPSTPSAPRVKAPAGVRADAKRYAFNTWGELLDHTTNAVSKPGHSYGDTGGSASWAGTANLTEAIMLARTGWAEGERMVRALADKLEAALVQGIVREEWNYDVEGTAFDIARYLEGEPECWVKVEEQADAHARRHVKVVVNMAASGGVDAHTLTKRGAVCAALVSLLEYAGTRVELWAVFGASKGHGEAADLVISTCVKAYDQPLEPARVAFALANPAYLRRLMFKVMEADADPAFGVHMYPTDAPHEASDLYIGEMLLGNGPWQNEQTTLAWLRETLKAQGIQLKE